MLLVCAELCECMLPWIVAAKTLGRRLVPLLSLQPFTQGLAYGLALLTCTMPVASRTREMSQCQLAEKLLTISILTLVCSYAKVLANDPAHHCSHCVALLLAAALQQILQPLLPEGCLVTAQASLRAAQGGGGSNGCHTAVAELRRTWQATRQQHAMPSLGLR